MNFTNVNRTEAMKPSIKQLFFKEEDMGVGNRDRVRWLCSAGQVGAAGGHWPGAPDQSGKDTWGRKDETNKAPLPSSCLGARPRQALVRMDGAKDSPRVNEFQGQLGIQLCQKRPLNQAGESSVWRTLRGAVAWQPPWESGGDSVSTMVARPEAP